MNRSLSRALTLLSLLTWSAVLLGFYFSGRLNPYLIAIYRPLVAGAGFGLLALAGILVANWRVSRLSPLAVAEDEPGMAGASGRSRGLVQIVGFLVLIVPVATAVGVSEDSFGANTVRRRGLVTNLAGLPTKAAAVNPPAAAANPPTATAVPELPLPGMPAPDANNAAPAAPVDVSSYLPTSKEGHLLISVVDLLMAAEDDTLRPQFEGRTVELVGQFMPDKKNNPNGDRFNLVRMFMVCCAADARPVAVAIESPQPPKLAEMQWAKIVGRVGFPVEDGRRTVVVRSDSSSPSDPPPETMLY